MVAVASLPPPEPDPASAAGSVSDRSRYALAGFLVFMGVLHFVVPRPFERIVPRWVGHARGAVFWSGVAEAASGILVALPRTRRLGAALAAATFVAVYPANVQMAVDAGFPPEDAFGWGVWLRLPLQFPLIAWALRLARA